MIGGRARRAEAASVSPTVGPAELAVLVHRLAVLLAAGVAPLRAWGHLASAPAAEMVLAAARDGPAAIPDAIAGIGRSTRSSPTAARASVGAEAWKGLAATWAVSVAAGTALGPTLRGYAELLRGFAAVERSARIAITGPRATSRLVLVLPVVAIGFSILLGQDTLGVLLGTPLGWVCLAAGALLVLGGWAWSRRLLRAAIPDSRIPGIAEELTAVAMTGGVSVRRARALVAEALERYGLQVDATGPDATLALAAESGAPAAELLRAEAEELRRAALARSAERTERISVLLMLPLGICVLPAFIAVGIIPMMAAIVGDVLTPL